MTNKLDTDAKNLTKDGETNLINKLSNGSDISKPKDKLVTDKQVNTFLNNKFKDFSTDVNKKANIDASNLKKEDIEKWQSTLGNGKVDKDNKGLVTGGTVYNKLNEVKTELNKHISANEGKINDINKKYNDLDKRVTTNTSDIKTLKTDVENLKKTKQDITNINNKLGGIDKSITNINTKLDGKLDKSDLSIKGDDYIKVNKGKKFDYTLSFNKTKLESDLDLTNNKSINNMFNNKLGDINTNLGDLTTKVKNNTNSITTLTGNVNTNTKDINTLKQNMTNKLDTDAKNLTKDGETNLINKLSKGSDISKPKDKLVTDRQVNTFLNNKFKDFSTDINNKVINTMQQDITVANKKADLALTGISNAVALANLPQVASYGKYKHMLTAAYGNYGGVNALALGFSGTTDSRRITYKISGSVNTKGNLAFGTGIGIMLGEIHDGNVDTPSHVKEQLIKFEKERQLMRTALTNQENKAKQQENQIKDLYKIIGELQEQLKNNEEKKEIIEKH